MKGVLICGGTGSRLLPLTQVTHKSLLPVYNQPLINYPLSTLLNAGITDIMVITGPELAGAFMQYLGSGSKFHCKFTYRIQDTPGGIAQALGMAEEFANGDDICAILGDNIYLDHINKLKKNLSIELVLMTEMRLKVLCLLPLRIKLPKEFYLQLPKYRPSYSFLLEL